MSFVETVRTGFAAIAAHRSRSALTVLGILIGVAAVILSVGVGQGAQSTVNGRIASLGTNLLIITSGSSTSSGVRGGQGSANTLTVADARALSNPLDAPDVAAVAPVTQRSMTLTAKQANWTASVTGSTPTYFTVRNRSLADGRFFSGNDLIHQTRVAVLGSTTAQNLFGGAQAVGQTANIGGVPFTVVGVLAPAGSSASSNEDDLVVVPSTTAQDQLFGGTSGNSLQSIFLTATSKDTMAAAYQEANSLLLQTHRVSDPGAPDFNVTTQQSLLSTARSISQTLTVLLGSVAAISLLVGGIGVMNIMLVSVTERIREIGLRKAVGATATAIRRQFLVEAVVLGAAGGIAGVGLGVVAALVLPSLTGVAVEISPLAIAVAIVTSGGLGLVFGVYPASRAASLPPIDALRTE
jgi:putative ABC transport system permease protein